MRPSRPISFARSSRIECSTSEFSTTASGAFAGERTRPIPSVACYVPRGKGAFPSVALMSTIPARVAGVPEIVAGERPSRS